MKRISKLLKKQDGATAIEYGLIAALIAVVIIATVTTIGTRMSSSFSTVGSSLNTTL